MNLTEDKKLNIIYFFKLIKSVINGTVPPEPEENIDFEYIFEFAKDQSMAGIVFYAIERLRNKPDRELFNKWRDWRNMKSHKYLVQSMELNSISELLKKERIQFAPFKGLCVSNLYPKPEQREMSDHDILIHEEDLSAAGKILGKLGYSVEKKGTSHHDSYIKKPFMYIELHRELIGINRGIIYDYFKDIWQRCERVDEYEYKMNDMDFIMFSIVHLYKHYISSGCGIKGILDIYFMNKKQLPLIDKNELMKNLDTVGLVDFYNMITEISEKWFEKDLDGDFSDDELFFISSGTFGNKAQFLYNNKKGKSNARYFMERLFPPVVKMKYDYAVLRKHIYLLPIFYVVRLIVNPFNKTKRNNVKKEISFFKKNKNI